MLSEIIKKIVLNPHIIWNLIWSLTFVVSMCLIFHAWEEKWWKSLIPIYGTYLVYKNAWKNYRWMFLIELVFSIMSANCGSFMKKQITHNIFFAIKTLIETKKVDLDINVGMFFICIILLIISSLIVIILKRVTYIKICATLSISNVFLLIGTFLFPKLFLLIDYIVYAKRTATQKRGTNA